jgi:chromosome segregation ATPase
LKNIESFYEEEEEVELPSFSSPDRPDPVLGSANNFGGSPKPPQQVVKLSDCNRDLQILNANYKVYLNDRNKTIESNMLGREIQRKNLDADSKELVNLNKNLIKDAISDRQKIYQDIKNAESELKICTKRVTPLIKTLDKLKICCDTSSAASEILDKQLSKCNQSGSQLENEITAAKNKYNSIQNEIFKLTNNKNKLNQNLIDCSNKNIYYRQLLAGCKN